MSALCCVGALNTVWTGSRASGRVPPPHSKGELVSNLLPHSQTHDKDDHRHRPRVPHFFAHHIHPRTQGPAIGLFTREPAARPPNWLLVQMHSPQYRHTTSKSTRARNLDRDAHAQFVEIHWVLQLLWHESAWVRESSNYSSLVQGRESI